MEDLLDEDIIKIVYSSTYCCVFVLYAAKLVGNGLMSCCINGAAAAEDEDYASGATLCIHLLTVVYV